MFVFVFLCCDVCIGRELCAELITRSKECLNKIQKSKKVGQGPEWAVKTTADDDDNDDESCAQPLEIRIPEA
jgi:regulator of RNase E activity RraB